MNEQEILKEILARRLVGQRIVDDLQSWKCIHEVDLHEMCEDCARSLSFRDEVEGK